MKRDSIYVEIPIRDDIDELWRLTQNPDEHERWDLRFTDIEYLPHEDGDPQEFTYRTRIGGLGVSGTGESVGERKTDGEWTSTLVFRSGDPKALIREGNGFWKYRRTDDGIRFLTEYNYDTRFGRPGQLFDTVVFRPLIGWATAWSFDRLRLWLEEEITPEASLRDALTHGVARLSLAFVWIYQGLVPKLLVSHPTELALLRAGGVPAEFAEMALYVIGSGEVLFGLCLLVFWRTRSLLLVAAALPLVLTIGVVVGAPGRLVGPFNPIALTAAMIGLGIVGYLAGTNLPTARNCLREPP